MPVENYKTISIREDLYLALQEEYKKRTSGKRVPPKFSPWLSALIWECLQKESEKAAIH